MSSETGSFARKSRDLEMLYDVVATINVAQDLTELLTRSLRILVESTAARAAVVRLLEPQGVLRLVGDLGFTQRLPLRQSMGGHSACICQKAIDQGHIQTDDILQSRCGRQLHGCDNPADLALLTVPMQYRGRSFGVINLYVHKSRLAEDDDLIVLLTSIGQHLGMAIERVGLDKETERLSRIEERAHLAHELHDSLAQTLASVRLQIHLLDETLRQGDISVAKEKMKIVENSVEEAYKELRNLIVRFRIPFEDSGVVPSIQNVVKTFKEESGMSIHFHNDFDSVDLPAEIESEVARIIQEALHNARRHSGALTVRVLMRRVPSDRCQILIEDDGDGLLEASNIRAPGEHQGLNIMRERAENIGGELKIESEINEGTRVRLTFPYLPPITEDVYSEPQQRGST